MSETPFFYKFILIVSVWALAAYGFMYYNLLSAVMGTKGGWMNPVNNPLANDFVEIGVNKFVYSAYLDARTEPVIRIIGVGPRTGDGKVQPKCFLVYRECSNCSKLLSTVAVELRKILLSEHHNKTVSSVFFDCKLIGYFDIATIIPVKLVIKRVDTRTVSLPVRTLISTNPKRNFAVCVRPLFGSFTNVKKLAEFVAFYTVMGVNHFTFYDYDTGLETKTFLETLAAKSNASKVTIDALPWSCPKHLNVWQAAQVTSAQECVYRHAKAFKYLAIIDLDELIVPRTDPTLLHLLKRLDTPKVGAFLFRQSFFCDQKAASKGRKGNTEMSVVKSLTREKYIWPPYKRSKVVVKPETVIENGIHHVHKFVLKNHRHLMVGPQAAIIHHLKFPRCRSKKQHISDNAILKFQKDLAKAQF